MTIQQVGARLLRAPLRRAWGPDATHNHVVVVTVRADDGAEGVGLAWTPTVGPTAVLALVQDDIAPRLAGAPEDPAVVSDQLWLALHEGGSGLVGFARAGVDLALWDLRAKRAGRSVADLLGRRREEVRSYGSGVNLDYPLEDLVAQAQEFVDEGHTAIKMKIGKPDLGEDVDRVAAVREVLGTSGTLMVDSNQRWDLPTARRAIRALDRFDLHWVEEPLRAEDLEAHRRLRAAVDVPIALGENVHSVHRFYEYVDAEAVDVLQPNLVRVGGLTPFLRVVELARHRSLPITPHLLPELSTQVALAVPEVPWVEDIHHGSLHALGLLRGQSPIERGPGVVRQRGLVGWGLEMVAESPA